MPDSRKKRKSRKSSRRVRKYDIISNPKPVITPKLMAEFDKLYGNYKHDDPDFYAKIYNEMVEYQKMPNKIEFVPLSIDIAAKNIGKKIWYYYANGMSPDGPCGPDEVDMKDRNNFKKVFVTWLKVDGDLHYFPDKNSCDVQIYPGWLRNQKSFKIKKGMFLYLTGTLSYHEPGTIAYIQIGDPLKDGKFKGTRVLSDNTINGDDWVAKGKYG